MAQKPGLAAGNTAGVFEGLQGALGLYLKLKQQEVENKQKDSQLERQNNSQDALAKYYQAQAGNLDADNQRQQQVEDNKQLNTFTDRYPGMRVPANDPIVQLAQKRGMGAAFQDESTLPSQQSAGIATLPSGEGDNGTAQVPSPVAAPGVPTGNKLVVPTEDSKMRTAAANQAGQNARAGAANDIKMFGIQTQANTAERANKVRLFISELVDAAKQKGIDTADARFHQKLEQAERFALAAAEDKDIDNERQALTQGGANAVLRQLLGGDVSGGAVPAPTIKIADTIRGSKPKGAPANSDPLGIR